MRTAKLSSPGRRRFLYGIGAVGALAGLGSSFWLIGSDENNRTTSRLGDAEAADQRAFRRTSLALGSSVTITVLHEHEAAALEALDAAFAELELVEGLMSIYRPDSQLSKLNREGVLAEPHPYLLDVLQYAHGTSERTEGAFDVTIQPLWACFEKARQAGRLPTDADLERARSRVDWRRVEFDSERVCLRGAGTQITLNGIAQGYAADRVRAKLEDCGVRHALIDTGEISALGAKPGREGWRVGVQHPREADAYLSLTRLAGRCLATSGDYATAFTPDRKHHHLFDPRTGRSPSELASVTIAADTALAADTLSTTVFVLGMDAGAALIEQMPGTDGLIVAKSGKSVATAGFPFA